MEQLGYIGLGAMGFPMAKNLIKAGYPVMVANRSNKEKVSELVSMVRKRRP